MIAKEILAQIGNRTLGEIHSLPRYYSPMKKIFVRDFPFKTMNCFLFLRNYSQPLKHLKHSFVDRFAYADFEQPLPNGDYFFHRYCSCDQLVLKADDVVYLWIED